MDSPKGICVLVFLVSCSGLLSSFGMPEVNKKNTLVLPAVKESPQHHNPTARLTITASSETDAVYVDSPKGIFVLVFLVSCSRHLSCLLVPPDQFALSPFFLCRLQGQHFGSANHFPTNLYYQSCWREVHSLTHRQSLSPLSTGRIKCTQPSHLAHHITRTWRVQFEAVNFRLSSRCWVLYVWLAFTSRCRL